MSTVRAPRGRCCACRGSTHATAYLRRVRLEHAHQDLKRASPGDGVTVTAVAYRWGFNSSSRFAAAYHRAYGASPSRTLREG